MNNIFLICNILFELFYSTIANAEGLSDKDIEKLPEDYRRFIFFNRKIQNSKEYLGLKTASFDEYKGGAVTLFVKREKSGTSKLDEAYQVVIKKNQENKIGISFLSYEKCTIDSKNRILHDYIKIDSQKIKAEVLCAPSRDGSPLRVYMPSTDQGVEYIYRIFANTDIVFVEIDGKEVPFFTKGFRERWAEEEKPAI